MSTSGRSQSQGRGAGSQPVGDSKGKQDVCSGGKPGKSPAGGGGGNFPRGGGGGGGRRRDHNSSSITAVNPRRPAPLSRGGRKCPQGRGGRGGQSSMGTHYNQPVTEDDELFEVGSIFKAGSKKQSLNHLLNFQYEPRGSNSGGGGGGHHRSGPRGGRGNGTRHPSVNKHQIPHTTPYKKEHYIRANCQFVVSADGDYTVHTSDPDILVNWDNIEQVHLKSVGSEPTACPICLFPPIAAKIARCGHIFCWPCILHYLALSDDNYRKCPICNDAIQRSDLKSVVTIQQENFATGCEIEMRLMRRERHSLFALPVMGDGGSSSAGYQSKQTSVDGFPDVDCPPEARGYFRLLKATPSQVSQLVLGRERAELEEQYRAEKDQPEACFIQEALAMLADREMVDTFAKGSKAEGNLPGCKMNEVAADCENVDNQELLSTNTVCTMLSPMLAKLDMFGKVDDAKGYLTSNDNLENLFQLSDEVEGVERSTGSIEETPERARFMSSSSDASSEGEEGCVGLDDGGLVRAEDLDISSVQPINLPTTEKMAPKDTFYFYQCSDGQPIFLHALNVQMLVEEFGSLERCPHVIRAKILEKDSSSMTLELRDRLRYLRHLPVACGFEVAELNLVSSQLLSRPTIAKFKDQLDSRASKRARKQREEKRREKRILVDEMRIMGRLHGPMFRIESEYHNPGTGGSGLSLGGEGWVDLASSGGSGDTGDTLASSTWDVGQNPATSRPQISGLNFAKIIRSGVSRPDVIRPKPAPLQAVLSFRPRGRGDGSDSEPEPEGWVPPPPSASLGDALALALAAKAGGGSSEGAASTGGKKKGRKGKGKPILISGASHRPCL